MEIKTENLAIVGDIHGEFPKLIWDINNKYEIKDTTFIIAGDCGIGFDNSLDDMYIRKSIGRKLGDCGNTILCIRGNHDNPKYFSGEDLIDYPNLKTLPDYTHLTWGDRKVLVIGGGVSVDREQRKKDIDWWEDERIIKSPDLVDIKEDIIVSHMAPLCIGPVLIREEGVSNEIWSADKDDREYLSTVLKETRPERWIFGHYHRSTSGNYDDCIWRGLDINEVYEIR